jgi:hypothetical protein
MTNFEMECRKKQSFHDSSVDKSNCVESHNSVLGKTQTLGLVLSMGRLYLELTADGCRDN